MVLASQGCGNRLVGNLKGSLGMTVYDTGRETPYDFQYQSAYYACAYDVVWRVLRLQMFAGDTVSYKRSISIAHAYTEGALDENEKLMRLIRIVGWMRSLRAPQGLEDDLEDFKLGVFVDYRDLRNKLYPRKYRGKFSVGTDLMWDWHKVRTSLRSLFAQDPHTFVDVRLSVKNHSKYRLREERNYFIMLCDEDTYVR